MGNPPLSLGYEEVTSCPLCGYARSSRYAVRSDTLANEINRFLPADADKLPRIDNVMRRCLRCDLVYLSPRLDDASLSKIYSLWYGFAFRKIIDDPGYIQERKAEFENHHMRLFKRYALPRESLLDVGCGTGLFLHVAAGQGWKTVGIESEPDTASGCGALVCAEYLSRTCGS